MFSIPETLKEAFEKKDWSLISVVYQGLTGNSLDDGITFQPKTQQLQPQQQNKSIPTQNRGKTMARTESVDLRKIKAVGNLFTDDGSEAIADKAIDKKLVNKIPIQRNRPSDVMNITCNNCGKMFNVNKALVTNKGFICSPCMVNKSGK